MCAGCNGGNLRKASQGGFTEDNNPENATPYKGSTEDASQRSDKFLGKAAGAAAYGGQAAPVGEADQSGVHTGKTADPGFKG